jgi:hypothetical protein
MQKKSFCEKILHISDIFKSTASPEVFQTMKIKNTPCFFYYVTQELFLQSSSKKFSKIKQVLPKTVGKTSRCAIACTTAAFAGGIAATGGTSSESGHQTRVEEAAFVTLNIRALRKFTFLSLKKEHVKISALMAKLIYFRQNYSYHCTGFSIDYVTI